MVYISQEVHDQNKKSWLKPGDIIISKTGATIGKVSIIPDDMLTANTTASVGKITLDPKRAYNRYIYRYLQSPEFQSAMWRVSKKSAQPGFNVDNLKKFLVPVPDSFNSVALQKLITNILDKAFLLIKKRQNTLALADEFLRSTFLEMFGDPILNRRDWPIKKFGEVGELERGRSKHRPRNAPHLLGGPYPLIQTGEIANAARYIKNYSQTYSEEGLRQSRIWPVGTLCITIAANIGKTAILTFEACFPDSIVGYSPNEEVRTEFVQFWISFLQKKLEVNAPESAQKNINLEILKNLTIPVPPIGLQNKFSEIVLKVEVLKEKYQESYTEMENQFHSLMQKAFRGEL